MVSEVLSTFISDPLNSYVYLSHKWKCESESYVRQNLVLVSKVKMKVKVMLTFISDPLNSNGACPISVASKGSVLYELTIGYGLLISILKSCLLSFVSS